MEADDASAKANEISIKSTDGIPDTLMGCEKHLEVLIPSDGTGDFVDDKTQTLQCIEVITSNLINLSQNHHCNS